MITIGYSTRDSKPDFKEYLTKTCSLKNIQIIEKINNGDKSLSQVYNEIIDESEHNIIVLCHDDIEFDTNKWGDKLLKNFSKNPEYGILGMAGTKYLDSSSQWWKVPQTMYGIVNHKNNGKKWESKYSNSLGDSIEEVVLVDGLFISFDKTKIKHKFDESIKGFHFYDLGFSIPNYLDDVNIGVMFNIRLTHLSIGQTNQQWENNRYFFSQKYRNDLPIDITDTEYDNETFICVHDQNIILDYENRSKFNILKNYRYIFLGDRPTDLIQNNPKVIIARKFENNLEDYPYFTAFTGWYLLWKNNLITTKYITLLEYDTLVNENFEQIISKMIYENKPMIGYVPVSVNNYHYIDNNNWVEHIFKAITEVYKMNIQLKLKTLISKTPNLSWSSTSNITFRNDIFNDFMKWFEPLIPHLKDTQTSGHAFERAVSFYYFTKNKEMVLTNGVIKHIQMDSHKTQGHQIDFDKNMTNLINNNF
jgi:hypothetical protein